MVCIIVFLFNINTKNPFTLFCITRKQIETKPDQLRITDLDCFNIYGVDRIFNSWFHLQHVKLCLKLLSSIIDIDNDEREREKT